MGFTLGFFYSIINVYVLCFSERKDNLNMWRGYGDGSKATQLTLLSWNCSAVVPIEAFLYRSRTETATIFNHHLQSIGQQGLNARADFIIHQALQHRGSRWSETLVRLVGIEFKRHCDKQNNN